MDDASTVVSYDSVSEEKCDAEKMALAEQIIGFVENGQMDVNTISPDMEHCIGMVLRRRRLQREADDVSTIPDAYPEMDESSVGTTVPDAYPEMDESSMGGDAPALEPEPAPAMETIDEDEDEYQWEYGVPGPDQMLSSIDDAYEGEGLDEIVHWDDTLGRWVLLDDENFEVIGELNEAGEPIFYGDF